MKILIYCSTLDMKYKMGCTPHWWQFFKALYELNHDVIVIPHLGNSIESLWWRTYENPLKSESKIYNYILKIMDTKGKQGESLFSNITNNYINTKIEKILKKVIDNEKNIDAIVFFSVPHFHIINAIKNIKKEYSIPIFFFEGDMPIALPKYQEDSSYKFQYYDKVDLSIYDGFFTNSKGVINDLKNMEVSNPIPLYYGVDPQLYFPIDLEKDIDVSFYGFGSSFREKWMQKLIEEPSGKDINVTIAGMFNRKYGKANYIGDLSFSEYKRFCSRSKICLNVVRENFGNIFMSSSARIYELPAMKSLVISSPYSGAENWYTPDKEIILLKEEDDVCEVYNYIINDFESYLEVAENGLKRTLKEHTYLERAKTLIKEISVKIS